MPFFYVLPHCFVSKKENECCWEESLVFVNPAVCFTVHIQPGTTKHVTILVFVFHFKAFFLYLITHLCFMCVMLLMHLLQQSNLGCLLLEQHGISSKQPHIYFYFVIFLFPECEAKFLMLQYLMENGH